MLHRQYLKEGSEVELPELDGHIQDGTPTFVVLRVLAGGMGLCIRLRHAKTNAQYALKFVRP